MLHNFTLLLSAILVDLILGEPPEKIHPVVWYGKLITIMEKFNDSSPKSLIYGFFTTTIVLVFSYLVYLISKAIPQPFSFFAEVYLLKSSFSIKSMVEHVSTIIKSDFDSKYVQMIVSRDAKKLNYNEKCSAVIESLAENFVDSVLAPLFYFCIFGLAGSMIYRATNTCDAMIGYKNRKYFWFGKFAARLDDILNFIPARLSIVIFSIASRKLLKIGKKEKIKGKINACSMIAMAYALNLRLEKPNYYVINENGKVPNKADVLKALRFFKNSCFITVSIFLIVTIIK